MAADQPNRNWFTYVDGHGTAWNKLGQVDAGCNAIDGNAAAVATQPVRPRAGRRYRTRSAIYFDPTTFRTKTCVIYTDAAAAAIDPAATLPVHVQGEATAVDYTFRELTPDRSPLNSLARELTDHA